MKFAPLLGLLLALGWLGAGVSGCTDGSGNFDPYGHHGSHGAGGSGGGGGGATGGGGGGGTGGTGDGSTISCSATAVPAFSVRWIIEDLDRHPTTCTAVGAATMDLDVLDVATSAVYHDTFACAAMAGVGSTLPAGDYSVAMRLRDAAGTLLSDAVAPTTLSIKAGCSTDLGSVPFDAAVTTADQFIRLRWSIDRGGAPLSCAQAQATTVELTAGTTDVRWPCADSLGATPSLAPGTYQVALKLLGPTGAALSVTPTAPLTITAGQANDIGDVIFDVN
jgi:hypothetical protein